MKILMVSIAYSLFAISGVESINPDKTILHLFELYDGVTKYSDGTVRVRGVAFNQNNEENSYREKGNSYYMPLKEYEYFYNLGLSTFEATPGDDGNSFGTAFHIGGEFILTNQHVLSTNRRNITDCKRFRIKLNRDQYNLRVMCKKVHYCDKDKDYCLIEMHNYPHGQSLSDKMGYTLNTEIEYGSDVEHIIIGNTRGYGLHASKGIGTRYSTRSSFRFHAPVFGGNSGGPIFNTDGEVIGIVKRQSAILYSDRAYNVGISIKEVLHDLEENLEDPSILDQLNIKQSDQDLISPSHNQDNPTSSHPRSS